MREHRGPENEKRGAAPDPSWEGPLRAMTLIETVGASEPFAISLVRQCCGSAASELEAMAARVKWANKVRYRVLTRNVPVQFAPYNAVIRILGTEDIRVDYLATLID